MAGSPNILMVYGEEAVIVSPLDFNKLTAYVVALEGRVQAAEAEITSLKSRVDVLESP